MGLKSKFLISLIIVTLVSLIASDVFAAKSDVFAAKNDSTLSSTGKNTQMKFTWKDGEGVKKVVVKDKDGNVILTKKYDVIEKEKTEVVPQIGAPYEVDMQDTDGTWSRWTKVPDTPFTNKTPNEEWGPVGGIVEFPQIEEPGTAIPDSSDHNYGALAGIIVGAIAGVIALISAVWYVRRRRTKAI